MTYYRFLVYVSCFFLLLGCYQAKEGCLDNRALNYDVSADRNCCCRYPELIVRTNWVWKGSPLELDSVYSLGNTRIRLLSAELLVSNFTLKNEGGITIVSDSTRDLLTLEGKVSIRDDFGQISLANSEVKIPFFIVRSDMDSLAFTVGLPRLGLSPVEGNTHPLSVEKSHWDAERGFAIFDMKWLAGDDLGDTISCVFYSQTEKGIQIRTSQNIEGELGRNTSVDLTLDMGIWLEGISPSQPDSAILLHRLPKAFH